LAIQGPASPASHMFVTAENGLILVKWFISQATASHGSHSRTTAYPWILMERILVERRTAIGNCGETHGIPAPRCTTNIDRKPYRGEHFSQITFIRGSFINLSYLNYLHREGAVVEDYPLVPRFPLFVLCATPLKCPIICRYNPTVVYTGVS
jgi:hypothetical protein